MRPLLFCLLFACAGPALAGPCDSPRAEACGPGEVQLPFLKAVREAESAAQPPRGFSPPGPALSPKPSARKLPAIKSAVPGLPEKTLAIFYTYDCPHCREAIAWLPGLQAEYPGLKLEKYEVKRQAANRRLLAAELGRRGVPLAGFPTIVIGGKVLTGFAAGRTPLEVRAELDRLYGRPAAGCPAGEDIRVPLLGRIDPAAVSLPAFSFALGLLDGLNPCAMWVLMFLMGLLLYTRSRRRMLFIGAVFVAASGLVYFAFMAAWFNLFLVIGHARWITAGLAVIAVLMGLVNLKEIFFFKKGFSLMIADGAKTGLAARVRGILNEHGTSAMAASTVLLAFFVNLIELGCTIGLPAVFTRVLSLRGSGLAEKYWYMAVYNAAYVVPLALIVSVFVCTMGRYRLTESHGKLLKGVSGFLLLLLGLLMLLRPEALLLG